MLEVKSPPKISKYIVYQTNGWFPIKLQICFRSMNEQENLNKHFLEKKKKKNYSLWKAI